METFYYLVVDMRGIIIRDISVNIPVVSTPLSQLESFRKSRTSQLLSLCAFAVLEKMFEDNSISFVALKGRAMCRVRCAVE